MGINQSNLASMLSLNSSAPNIAQAGLGPVAGSVAAAAARRLPQIPPEPLPGAAINQPGFFSKLFGRKATPQQETNQRLQQQLLLNQQQSLQHQQQLLGAGQPLLHPHLLAPPLTAPPLVAPPLAAPPTAINQIHNGQVPTFQNPLLPPVLPTPNNLQNIHLPQTSAIKTQLGNKSQLPAPPPKKAGEGWGGRGARLPQVPVPLPSLPPRSHTLTGYGSHSLEEVEQDLFLDRIVAVGRGSRRLPNPGAAKAGPPASPPL